MSNKIIQIGKATLINGDCMEYMSTLQDKAFDLAVVDPPYGIGAGGKQFINSGNKFNKEIYRNNDWDQQTPGQKYFDELKRISSNQIIWGGNYFISFLESTRGFIVWDKMVPENFSYAMCEFAWTSFDKNAKIFVDSNRKDIINRIHPTQKPVKLYEWIFTNYAKPGQRILDTHGGSMSSVIAALNLGFEIVCIEKDEEYFNAAADLVIKSQQQQRMF